MPLSILRGDITRCGVDAIVNPANTGLVEGGGVCGAVFQAAGAEPLRAACALIGGCDVGQAVVTWGYGLRAKYIIHTVCPAWQGGGAGERELLAGCCRAALTQAVRYRCRSVAFPLLAAGQCGFPREEALRVSTQTIRSFLAGQEEELEVTLVVYDLDSFRVSRERFAAVRSYIDENDIRAHPFARTAEERPFWKEALPRSEVSADDPFEDIFAIFQEDRAAPRRSLEEVVAQVEDSFSTAVLRLIDRKGKTDVEVYKRANLDRKLFSKIRTNPNHRPSRDTAVALALALELNLDETVDLLGRAGYTLSHSRRQDLIIEYFITEGLYDVIALNETLFAFHEPTLGG